MLAFYAREPADGGFVNAPYGALPEQRGTLLVASHDAAFLARLALGRRVTLYLPGGGWVGSTSLSFRPPLPCSAQALIREAGIHAADAPIAVTCVTCYPLVIC